MLAKYPPAQYWTRQLNPTWGCDEISKACLNCWAKTFHNRFHLSKKSEPVGLYKLPFNTIQFCPDRLSPKNKYYQNALDGSGETVFVGNMSDLFHKKVPGDIILMTILTILTNHQHNFLVLTKRPEKMLDCLTDIANATDLMEQGGIPVNGSFVPENAWFGASIWDQKSADHASKIVEKIPGNIWYSFEPLLGEITDVPIGDWAVIGSESGSNPRPFENDWAKTIIEAYQREDKPVFMKQGLDKNGKFTNKLEKLPAWSRIREFPWATNDEKECA